MSSKVIPILVFALSLTSIRCEESSKDGTDWCSLIKPNDTYKGLGMYRKFTLKDDGNGSYVMYNRAGAEWNFRVDGGASPYYDLTIQMVENSTKNSDADNNTVHRYGFFMDYRTRDPGKVFDCTTTFVETKPGFINKCVVDEGSQKAITDIETKFYPQFVIFKTKTDKDYEMFNADYFHVFDKSNKSNYFIYEPLEDRSRIHDCSKEQCLSLKFDQLLDDSLFAQIDDIVHVYDKPTKDMVSGHLVLFNIGGRPKYCYLPLIDKRGNIYSTYECRNSGPQDLFVDCFRTAVVETVGPQQGNKDNTQTDVSTQETTTSDTNTYIVSLFALTLSFTLILIPL